MSADEKEQRRITRREFVKGAAVGAAGVAAAGALAGCATPTPQVVKETVEVPVEVTRIVEKEVIKEVPAGAGPVTLDLSNPAGAREVTVLHTARLDTLEGKTICELSNLGWQSHRTFPLIRQLLQQQFPTATFIPYTEFPQGTSDIPTQETVDAVIAAGCDAVIAGNAG
jgi:hypothetical protein